MPKVSICIPAYNQTVHLARTLSSILIQSFTDYEIVITDDSPTSIVEDFVKGFDFKGRLKYYRNQTSLGSPENWNESMRKATGDYIKIMHHDDWFSTPTSLEKLVVLIESNDHQLAFCACDNIGDDEKQNYYHCITPHEAEIIKTQPEFLFYANKIGAPSVTIFKRTAFGFDNKIKYLVDLEFYIRLLKLGGDFSYTTEPLISIGLNDGQVTNTAANNKPLLVFEHSYTYTKLHFNRCTYVWCFNAFWDLFDQQNIRSIAELRLNGWVGSIPTFIKYVITARNLSYMIKKNKFKKLVKYLTLKYTRLFF